MSIAASHMTSLHQREARAEDGCKVLAPHTFFWPQHEELRRTHACRFRQMHLVKVGTQLAKENVSRFEADDVASRVVVIVGVRYRFGRGCGRGVGLDLVQACCLLVVRRAGSPRWKL
jgi:hypothetical protein